MKRSYTYNVDLEFDGYSIKNFLQEKHGYSTNLIKSIKLTEDGILKNGLRAYTTHKIADGDVITINIDEKPSENIVPMPVAFEIVYEDADLMVINKPPGTPTHPSVDNYYNSVANGIMYYFSQKGESIAFHAVNRLDKDTSGLMLIAKNPYIHARLSDMLHTKSFVRKYRCVVHGLIDDYGTINAPIKRKDGSAIERTVAPDGQEAITHYSKIAADDEFSLVEIELETGRTHQIRVHMAYIGHPLVGDFLYGEEERHIANRHALHSSYIAFIHPITGEKMEFRSEIPEDMREIVKNIIKNIEKS